MLSLLGRALFGEGPSDYQSQMKLECQRDIIGSPDCECLRPVVEGSSPDLAKVPKYMLRSGRM